MTDVTLGALTAMISANFYDAVSPSARNARRRYCGSDNPSGSSAASTCRIRRASTRPGTAVYFTPSAIPFDYRIKLFGLRIISRAPPCRHRARRCDGSAPHTVEKRHSGPVGTLAVDYGYVYVYRTPVGRAPAR